jgi:CheY-like chemotaxis protein
MATAYGREEIIKGAETAGIVDVLVKPVNAPIVYDLMMGILGGKDRSAMRNRNTAVTASEIQLATISGARILLVEDNEINQQVASELLTDAGFVVEIAENGQVAIDRLQTPNSSFDLVLMDMQMPVMDGMTATRLLREIPQFNRLPILAMTANALLSDREKCLAAGMNAHLTKPIDPDELWKALLQWVQPREGLGLARSMPAIINEPIVDDPTPTLAPQSLLPQAIEGLDIKRGLKRLMGKESLYLGILRKFITEQGDFATRFEQAISNNDVALAERLAHTLKGVAGSIGAMQLATEAETLEAIARRCHETQQPLNPEEIQLPLSTLLPALTKLLNELAQHFAAIEPSAASPSTLIAFDPLKLAQICQQLTQRLAEDDPEAEAICTEHADLLNAAFGDQAKKMTEYIANFDFESALNVLIQAMQHAGIKGEL